MVPKFYAEVRKLFLASFKKDQKIQIMMTVQGLAFARSSKIETTGAPQRFAKASQKNSFEMS